MVDYQGGNFCIEAFDVVRYNIWQDHPNAKERIIWEPKEEYKEDYPILDESNIPEETAVFISGGDGKRVLGEVYKGVLGNDKYLIMTQEFFEDHFESLTEE